MVELSEGMMAVKLARDTIELYLENGNILSESDMPSVFAEKRGVFVTLSEMGRLRGCIGHPYPDSSLKDAIIDSAISAATGDPRFVSVTSAELEDLVVEVTILTVPELMDAKPCELPDMIEIGKHGLIAKMGPYQGLLLPQVAPENDFDAHQFLDQVCMKAGLPPDAWLTGAQIYSFQGQIFKEEVPGGNVVEEIFQSTTHD